MINSSRSTQMLLIDDDPDFGHLAQAIAGSFGIDLHYRPNLKFDPLSPLRNYAVIIIDYQLAGQNGLDLARHIAAEHPQPMPALVITSSQQTWSEMPLDWPVAIKRFIPKRLGVRAIILLAYTIGKQLEASLAKPSS